MSDGPPASPRLSFCIPVAPGGSSLLVRSLETLKAQAVPPSTFEVVIGIDGGDTTGGLRRTLRPEGWPFRVTLVDVKRSSDLPHRNHARNAALRAATGELVWVVDADFLWPPHAVAHALRAMDEARAEGRILALSPVLARFTCSAAEWARRLAGGMDLRTVATKRPPGLSLRSEYSGFLERAVVRSRPAVEAVGRILEGFPLTWREVFLALDGFDEAFVGWGGNKEELCRRLGALDGLVSYRLLASVTACHQPHPPDGRKRADDPLTRANRDRLRDLEREVQADAPWWLAQRARVGQVVARLTGRTPPSLAPREPQRPIVGVISVSSATKGLWRDTQILHWLVTAGPVRPGGLEAILSIFCVADLQLSLRADLELTSCAPPEAIDGAVTGLTLRDWMPSIDVLVCLEVLPPALLRRFLEDRTRPGRRVIYVVNLDWAAIQGSTPQWLAAMRELQTTYQDRFAVWAKAPGSARTLEAHGIEALAVPWTVPDPVVRERDPAPRGADGGVVFLANLGMGGWRGRRCGDVVLEAWREVRRRVPGARLLVKTIRPLAEQVSPELLEGLEGVTELTGLQPRAELAALYDRADVYIHMSRWEGFGLPLAEALHAGIPCVAPDAAPMNELVIDVRAGANGPRRAASDPLTAPDAADHRIDGLLVTCRKVGLTRLAPHVEPDRAELVAHLVRLAEDPALRRRLTAPEPGILAAKQHAFRLRARASLLGEPVPTVVLVGATGEGEGAAGEPGGNARRSERFWGDALALHGYRVRMIDPGEPRLERILLREKPDAVWVGKIEEGSLRRIRSATTAPVLLWHHDLVDYTPARVRWWASMVPRVDAAALPEDGLERFARLNTPMRTVFPGAKVESPGRAAGRRPAWRALEPAGGEDGVTLEAADERAGAALFLGGCDGPDDARTVLLGHLVDAGIPVEIHGEAGGWQRAGLSALPPLYGEAACRAYRAAPLALSVSRGSPLRHYSSNRLFNAAGSGAVVVAQSFAGLERLYPDLPRFRTPGEAVALCRRLLADPSGRAALRARLEEHTFRHHTWVDRVGMLLEWMLEMRPGRAKAGVAERAGGDVERAGGNVQHAGLHTNLEPEEGIMSVPASTSSEPVSQDSPEPPADEAARLAAWWEERARSLGPRGVGHTRWSTPRFEQETRAWWTRFQRLLAGRLEPRDRLVLDFGCGVGRFSAPIARHLGRRVIGIDVSPTNLEAARQACRGLPFQGMLVQAGEPLALPLEADSVDVLWTCTVLQHIPDQSFDRTITELRRVLRPGALVVLIENTHRHVARTSRSGHVVFRALDEYESAFPGVRAVDRFEVERELHTVFAGRLEAPGDGSRSA